MQPGDIIATRSPTWLSRTIRKAQTRSDNGQPALVSHVGLFISPDIVIQALSRVVTTPFPKSFQKDEYIVLSPLNLSNANRRIVVERALTYSSNSYGWLKILGQGLDVVFHTRWFMSHVFTLDKFPICSYVVAEAYKSIGLDFGVPTTTTTPDDILDFAMENSDKYLIVESTPSLLADIEQVYKK